MRVLVALSGILICAPLLSSQELTPNLRLSIGTPQSSVTAAFGKPFGPFNVTPGDDNAVIGVPTGSWEVYHLTAPPDRMYVTMVHFGARSNALPNSAKIVDSIMLMPAGKVTAAQVLKDEPAFASLCKTICQLVVVRNNAGNHSLLLQPTDSHIDTVLYFEGDSAILKWASVTSMQSVVSWAYAVPKSDFEARHKSAQEKVIGSWSPSIMLRK